MLSPSFSSRDCPVNFNNAVCASLPAMIWSSFSDNSVLTTTLTQFAPRDAPISMLVETNRNVWNCTRRILTHLLRSIQPCWQELLVKLKQSRHCMCRAVLPPLSHQKHPSKLRYSSSSLADKSFPCHFWLCTSFCNLLTRPALNSTFSIFARV